MRVAELVEFGAPDSLVEVWSTAIDELTLVQERAVNAGVLGGERNLLVVSPTTSGKTFVGEMAAAATAYQTQRPAFFLVPFRALADEHFELFRERYAELLSVVISTSDWSEFDSDIRAGNFGIAVMTYEKLTGLLVNRPQLLTSASVLVVDEMQMLSDRDRGPALEVMLTQLNLSPRRPQLIALSASLDSLNRLDEWLGATSVVENERPIPLEEGVLAPNRGTILARTGSGPKLRQLYTGAPDKDNAIARACSGLVADGKQVLVFRTSARKVPDTAILIADALPAVGLPPNTASLLELVEDSNTLEIQRRTLASGVGFHTAELPTSERRAVERSFRAGETRVLVSSGTLAMGVNLPTDVVLVADRIRWFPYRWEWQRESITVADYKNQVGRAGRLGRREEGFGILITDQDHEQRQMFDLYVNGEVEPIESKLPSQPFDDVVFKVVALELAQTRNALIEFLCSTFAYLTFWELRGGLTEIEDGVDRAIQECLASALVQEEDGRLTVTPAGRVFASHGIPLGPARALSSLADQLNRELIPAAELMFQIASCDQLFGQRRPYTRWNKETRLLNDPRPSIPLSTTDLASRHSLHRALTEPLREERVARVLLRSACLTEWSAGVADATLERRYDGCGPARLRAMGQTAAWLLDATSRAASVRGGSPDVATELNRLALRLRHGLPHQLAQLALVDAPGVGRSTLMNLLAGDAGRELYIPDNFLDADANDLAALLTPRQALSLQTAIIAHRGETLRRRHRSHRARAQRSTFNAQLIDDLYTAEGTALEHAVSDALNAIGLAATRLERQGHGEEDIQLDHPDGTVVISITASTNPDRPIRWNKAREVLGSGAGMNPINYVCVGRPRFHWLADQQARRIAREAGARALLLVTIDVLAEAILQCQEEEIDSQHLADLLARTSGTLDRDMLAAT